VLSPLNSGYAAHPLAPAFAIDPCATILLAFFLSPEPVSFFESICLPRLHCQVRLFFFRSSPASCRRFSPHTTFPSVGAYTPLLLLSGNPFCTNEAGPFQTPWLPGSWPILTFLSYGPSSSAGGSFFRKLAPLSTFFFWIPIIPQVFPRFPFHIMSDYQVHSLVWGRAAALVSV